MVRSILKNGDVLSGAVLAALGAFIVRQSLAWDYFGPDGPGPGFFPFWYGIAMTTLAVFLIVNNLRKSQADQTREDGLQPEFDWTGTGRALATWAAFAIAVALMAPLGFVLSFALLTFFIVVWIFGRPWLTAAITAVVAALAFHLAFPVMLGVELPTGMFGF